MRRREVRRLVLPAALVSALVITALLAPVLPLTNPVQMEVAARLAPPSAAHILGQDEYGRDVLSRIVWGARVSLSVAFLSAVIAGVLGTVLGLLGGYFRGLVELVTLRPAAAILVPSRPADGRSRRLGARLARSCAGGRRRCPVVG